jgi:lactoylglutathione lyase
MRVEHVAVWTAELERLRAFYERYFDAAAGELYRSATRPGFVSRFLTFPAGGARLELMSIPDLGAVPAAPAGGYAHLAVSAGSRDAVVALVERMRGDGVRIVSEPRVTGDGYFEAVVEDPDGNLVGDHRLTEARGARCADLRSVHHRRGRAMASSPRRRTSCGRCRGFIRPGRSAVDRPSTEHTGAIRPVPPPIQRPPPFVHPIHHSVAWDRERVGRSGRRMVPRTDDLAPVRLPRSAPADVNLSGASPITLPVDHPPAR